MSRRLRILEEEFNEVNLEVGSLLRAIKDTKSRKPKTEAQHAEDESWLDWGIRNAKRYGPQLLELLEMAA